MELALNIFRGDFTKYLDPVTDKSVLPEILFIHKELFDTGVYAAASNSRRIGQCENSQNAAIIFFKPRAMDLLSGRRSLMIETEDLSKVSKH